MPKAYSEVYEFINLLGTVYINKIPTKIYNIIKNNRDMNYMPKLCKEQKIEKGTLSKEALTLISALNLQYWCEPKEKIELKEKYIQNTKLEEQKYSYEKLFKNKKNTQENVAIVPIKKENIFKRILKRWLKI